MLSKVQGRTSKTHGKTDADDSKKFPRGFIRDVRQRAAARGDNGLLW